MLQLLLVFFFLHQSQGYGVKVQANVDIGDDGLASVVKDLMEEYLKNGKAEIDISELVQRVQMLAGTQSPQQMKLANVDDDEVKTKHYQAVKAHKESNEVNKPRKVDKEKDAKHTKKGKSYVEESSGNKNEKEAKKSHKLHKKNKKRESDGFSDDSKEKVDTKSHKSKNTNKNSESSESDDVSDDSIERAGKKYHESKKTKHAKIENNEAKQSKPNSDKNQKVKKGMNERKAQKTKSLKIDDIHDGSRENGRSKVDNKVNSKEKKVSSAEISSEELKERREKVHIFGTHEGINEVTPGKYPINNIRC